MDKDIDMLRTLVPEESELLRLCMSKKWMAVSMRSQSHPFEAAPSELAVRGKGTTALGIAVRSGAPRDTIQLLVEANIHQVCVTHCRRGSVLTEAMRHKASDEVLDYLLRAVIYYQSSNPGCIDIFGARDDLGRTALHCMVERVKQTLESGQRNPSNWFIFRNMLMARPDSAQILDCDGNTPLVYLLLLPRVVNPEEHAWVEDEIFRMVQLMVSLCPWVAAIARSLPEPWHELKQVCHESETDTFGDGTPTPIYYAILYGRSLDTIQVLIDANRKAGNASSTVVTPYSEVPLHIAISTQASIPIASRVLQDCPDSVLCEDIYGLTPVDWLWIRHVVDWYTGDTPSSVSRSRHLAGRFLDWHEKVTGWLSSDIGGNFHMHTSMESIVMPRPFKRVTEDLLDRMKVLLPAAAAASNPDSTNESWSLLHAACYVPCPLAMVHLALECSDSYVLATPDVNTGRLPLHYAASRLGGYAANYPVGFSRQLRRLAEKTAIPLLVSRCERACAIMDHQGQLPLHILLDAARHYREMAMTSSSALSARFGAPEVDALEEEALNVLIGSYPDSLEMRDGKSQLLPFQQAAMGPSARHNTIYLLLRHLPSLVLPTAVDAHHVAERMEI